MQTIQIEKGWNAVFLEVSPPDSNPQAVFANLPVDIVVGYFPPATQAQFMTDPGTKLFRQPGWGVWYARNRPDAFLTSLGAIYGQQAYLVHARSAFTWKLTGAALPPGVRWQADAYNLVGFSVAAPGAPTFAQFFAGSPGHDHNRIYRLANGTWRRVNDPAAEIMRSGEAFWIFCAGGSQYQGPLSVETRTRAGLLLSGAGAETITLRNQTDHPVTPRLEHVISGSNAVPFSILIQSVGDTVAQVHAIAVAKPDGSWNQSLPALEAGGAVRVPLESRVEALNAPLHSSLLKITTDMGTEVWIPVASMRNDLQPN